MQGYSIVIEEVEGQEKGQYSERSKGIMNGMGWLGDTSSGDIHRVMKESVQHHINLEHEVRRQSKEK